MRFDYAKINEKYYGLMKKEILQITMINTKLQYRVYTDFYSCEELKNIYKNTFPNQVENKYEI